MGGRPHASVHVLGPGRDLDGPDASPRLHPRKGRLFRDRSQPNGLRRRRRRRLLHHGQGRLLEKRPGRPLRGDRTDIWNRGGALAADPVDGNRFYLFKAGVLYASLDGGATWSAQNASAIPDKSGFLNVVPLPGKVGEIWICLDGNGLWRTSDGGKTFSKIGTFGSARLFAWGASAPGRTNPAAYCYGTQSGQWGLYRSVDVGITWVRINGKDNPFPAGAKALVADRQAFGRVYVGTGGRGVFCGQPVASAAPSAPSGLVPSDITSSQINLARRIGLLQRDLRHHACRPSSWCCYGQ